MRDESGALPVGRLRRRHGAAVLAMALGVAVMGPVGVGMAPASAGASAPSATATVAGGPVRLPVGTRAVGALPSASTVSVDVVLQPSDPAALADFDQAVTTPGSPQYRRFLGPGQFAARFGPAPSAIAATRAWLRSQGLAVGATSSDGLFVPASGPAAAVGQAFAVGFTQEQLPGGRLVREPSARPRVPATLAATVQGVVGLDDLAVARPQLARAPKGEVVENSVANGPGPHTGPSPCAQAQSAGTTASTLASAYSMASLEPADEGQGVTVGVYELEPYLPSNISTFESCYSPSPATVPTPVPVDGAATTSGPGSGESALDIEMVIGMAPRAAVDVYVGPNAGLGPLDVYAAMIQQDTAQVLSTSWGECEAAAGEAVVEAEASLFEQAAAQGQSVLAAAGDEGSVDCDIPGVSTNSALEVDDPASQPWVTGVGGTELDGVGPPPTETTWNTGLVEGTTGGGNSTLWTMPSWQLGPGVENNDTKPDDSYTGQSPCPLSAGGGTVSCREVPDVAADADPNTGFATFYDSSWQAIGGTSMGAPLWAAITALADEALGSRLGLLNPSLYQAGCRATAPFNDITTGNNQPVGATPSDPPYRPGGPYYPATAGYDLATGLGTPIVASLIPDLVTPVNDCPTVSGTTVASGPATGGTTVTVTGSNLGAVDEVDFGPGNAGSLVSVGASSVTVRTPVSPTGGWATAQVSVKTANDTIGSDGRDYFTFTGPRGYWTTASDGGIFTFGNVGYYKSLGGIRLNKPIVGMAATPSSKGYWLVASDGGIFAFGDAGFYGSLGAIALAKPIVGMASTPDGRGYWLVASDGGVFAFGDAGFFGSMGGHPLNQPVVGMAATPDGGGYWLVASDGGIFAFGDAVYYGSTGGIALTKPIVAMATTPDGKGYWLAASDGGIFTFGNAVFSGSLGSVRLAKPIVGMGTPFGGGGYWLVASDGGIFAFGSAAFAGSMGGRPLNAPMVGIGGT